MKASGRWGGRGGGVSVCTGLDWHGACGRTERARHWFFFFGDEARRGPGNRWPPRFVSEGLEPRGLEALEALENLGAEATAAGPNAR